ncbi:hypothetical protein, partial [Erwinia amylovora]|uniref:hypothetical protein n=1 Tax=Erwinia amylovora TaxID=552 RepID=UPI0020BFC9DA
LFFLFEFLFFLIRYVISFDIVGSDMALVHFLMSISQDAEELGGFGFFHFFFRQKIIFHLKKIPVVLQLFIFH